MRNPTGPHRLTINMAANVVSYSANLILSFVLTPFLIHTLGKEIYGFYPIANQMVSYLSILTTALHTMASRFVTVELVRGDHKKANGYYASALAANLLMSLILLVPMVLIVVYMDRWMHIPVSAVAAVKSLFALVFAAALVNITAAIFGIATFAKNRIDLRSLRELGTAALRLGLYFLFYRFMSPSIVWVGVVTLVVAVVNILFQMGYTRMLLPEIRVTLRGANRRNTMEMLTSGGWNIVNALGNALLTGTTMILANIFYGAAASGVYAIVQTVPQFLNGMICMLTGVFYPVITYRYAENDRPGLVREVGKAQNMVGLSGCAAAAVFSALAAEFFALWTPGEDARMLAGLSFLTILPHFIISCMWTLTNVHVVMNNVKTPALVTLGCGAVNIVAAVLCGRFIGWGLWTLPIISSSLQILWAGLFMPLYAARCLRVRRTTFFPPMLKAGTVSAVVIAAILWVKPFFALDTWPRLMLFGAVCGIAALLLFVPVLGGKEVLRRIKPK